MSEIKTTVGKWPTYHSQGTVKDKALEAEKLAAAGRVVDARAISDTDRAMLRSMLGLDQ
jgi:hypothetical protein